MTEPPSPPDRRETARDRLRQALSATPTTARELSQLVGLAEREVLSHLEHLQKSLKTQGQSLSVTPAECLDCGFIFRKRDRLSRPGKCPACRSTHLSEPRFSLG